MDLQFPDHFVACVGDGTQIAHHDEPVGARDKPKSSG